MPSEHIMQSLQTDKVTLSLSFLRSPVTVLGQPDESIRLTIKVCSYVLFKPWNRRCLAHHTLLDLAVRTSEITSGMPPMQAQAVGLDALLDFLSDCALMTAGVEVGADSPVDAVRLATLHGSKGLEFNTVFIVGARTRLHRLLYQWALSAVRR